MERVEWPCVIIGLVMMAVALVVPCPWLIYPGFALVFVGCRLLPFLVRRHVPVQEPSGFGEPISDDAFEAVWKGRIMDDPPNQMLH